MQEAWLETRRPQGNMNTFVVQPARAASEPVAEPLPVVLLLMDAGGMREELCSMAARLAGSGYLVAVPNLYYRRSRDFQAANRSRESMFAHMDSLTNAWVCADIQALLEQLGSDTGVTTKRVGCVGYCMSGPFAFAAAAALPDTIVAAASFHGVRLFHAGPDSPHLAANQIQAELYFGCAEQDEWAPASLIEGFDAYLQTTSLDYRLEWYPGTKHGFVFPQRDGIYHAQAAERHWEVLLDLFQRQLKDF